MKFMVEVQLKSGKIVKKAFYAEDLQSLSEQILDEFPTGKILSILGG